MKKFATAIALVAASTTANAESIVAINPMALLAGAVGVQYQQSLDEMSGWTVEYQTISAGTASASMIGGSYKKALDGSTFGNGVYWRAGAVNISAAAGSLALSGILPTATVGYDYPVNESVLVNFDIGLGGYAGLQVGMSF